MCSTRFKVFDGLGFGESESSHPSLSLHLTTGTKVVDLYSSNTEEMYKSPQVYKWVQCDSKVWMQSSLHLSQGCRLQ